MVEDVIVLVPLLARTARLVQVAVPVGMHEVAGPEQARQRAAYGRLVEDPPDLGNPRQDVVAGIAFLIEYGLYLAVQVPVKGRGQPGVHLDVPLGDEPADGVVPQQMVVSARHGGPPGILRSIRYRIK